MLTNPGRRVIAQVMALNYFAPNKGYLQTNGEMVFNKTGCPLAANPLPMGAMAEGGVRDNLEDWGPPD